MPSRKGKPNNIEKPIGLNKIYKEYIKDIPIGSRYYLTYKEYKKIAVALLKEAMDYILVEAGELKLGFNLGTIRIRKYKNYPHGRKRNHKVSNELGKTVYHLNLHTKGYYTRFFWQKLGKARVTGIKAYTFIPNRITGKRRLSQLFSNGQDYFE